MRSTVVRAAFAFALLAGTALAQDPAGDSMPPAAKAAFERGLRSAQLQDWALARRYFDEAWKTAPGSPAIALNLGLAYAKAGQEPIAIAWLQAFTTADPNSPKSTAARQECERLLAEGRKRLQSVFSAASAASDQIPNNEGGRYWIARHQAKAGMLDDALASLAELAGKYPSSYYGQSAPKQFTAEVLKEYAETMVSAGDPRSAAEALARIRGTGVNVAELVGIDYSWAGVAQQYIVQKDLDRAWQAAKQITNAEERGRKFGDIAKLRAEEGDYIPADEALPLLGEPWRSWLLRDLVNACVKQKDFARARRYASMAGRSYVRGEALLRMAEGQHAAGDIPGAQAVAREILTLGQPADIEQEYDATKGVSIGTAAAAHRILGNYPAALELTARSKGSPYEPFDPYTTLGAICHWQAIQGGDPKGAVKNLESFAKRYGHLEHAPTELYAWLADIQMKLGRYQEAIATAKRPKDLYRMDWRIPGWVDQLIKAGQVNRAIDFAQMLRRPHPPDEWWESMYARAARSIAVAQVTAGDLAGAEKMLATVNGDNNRAIALIATADAYAKRGARPQALGLLREAAMLVGERLPASKKYTVNAEYPEGWHLQPQIDRNAMLAKIAAEEERLGDAAAASATRVRIQPIVSHAAADWLKIAEELSTEYRIVDLNKVVETARTAKVANEIPSMLSDAAGKFGQNLTRVEILLRNATRR